MKSKLSILSALGIFCLVNFVFAATDASYFEGKWEVLIKGTPQGDATIPVRFETKDNLTMGYFTEEGSTEEKKMSTVKIEGDALSAAFNISGYDVTLFLKKVDEESAKGDLMGMFDAFGKKLK